MNGRRKFIVQCSAVAAMASIGPLAVSAASMATSVGLSRTGDRFRALLDKRFILRKASAGTEAVVRLTAVRQGPVHPGLEQFSLHFDGTGGPQLPEGIYRVHSPVLESFDLFVSPAGEEDGPVAYQASFSLLT